MSDSFLDEKTIKLLQGISQILDTEDDQSIFKLHKVDPDKLKEVLASQLASGNKKQIKDSIEKILKERKMVNENGQDSVDLTGKKGGGFSSITEFDADEIRKEFDAIKERAAFLKAELDALKTLLEDKIVKTDPSKFTVTVDTRKNMNLKGAIKRVYGSKTKEITFDMYKQALELRSRFYKEDIQATTEDQLKLK